MEPEQISRRLYAVVGQAVEDAFREGKIRGRESMEERDAYLEGVQKGFERGKSFVRRKLVDDFVKKVDLALGADHDRTKNYHVKRYVKIRDSFLSELEDL